MVQLRFNQKVKYKRTKVVHLTSGMDVKLWSTSSDVQVVEYVSTSPFISHGKVHTYWVVIVTRVLYKAIYCYIFCIIT